MKRGGKTLKVLEDGHPRRMADARNAWRKMSDEQREDFLAWMGLRPATRCSTRAKFVQSLLADRAWEQS
ncbi:hypothetical protein CMI47_02890 [Candidatus Pacearchaeota archaeon]|nr:hypothetical protein [Candidatus Pacearchaeota archaeon]